MQPSNLLSIITATTALLPTVYAHRESYKAKKICLYTYQVLHGHTWYDYGDDQADANAYKQIQEWRVWFSQDCIPKFSTRRLFIKYKDCDFVPVV
ncbi:hypothetical protein PspLS_09603 [Pyricularia sp. CBS 133598]|nr:hypothetical protein PspLS_09603 [Pyricularia sp. CBS 133598]